MRVTIVKGNLPVKGNLFCHVFFVFLSSASQAKPGANSTKRDPICTYRGKGIENSQKRPPNVCQTSFARLYSSSVIPPLSSVEKNASLRGKQSLGSLKEIHIMVIRVKTFTRQQVQPLSL